MCGTQVGMMALNFRGRIPNINHSDAGNYEGTIEFLPADFASPSLIRQGLQQFRRASKTPASPLPTGWALASSRLGFVTNWSTFFEGLNLGPDCEQLLHLPCHRGNAMDFCIIFRPCPGELGAIVLSHEFDPSNEPTCPFGGAIATSV